MRGDKVLLNTKDDLHQNNYLLRITLNKTCNMDCSRCYVKDSMKGLELTENIQYDKIISFIKDSGVKRVIFTGGEPLISKDLFRFLENCQLLGVKSTLLSNGLALNDALIDKIKTYDIESITISLKNIDGDGYKNIIGRDIFSKIMSNINNLLLKGINTELLLILGIEDNLKERFSTFLDVFKKLKGFPRLTIGTLKPIYKDGKISEDINRDHLVENFIIVYNLIKNKNINYKFRISFPLCWFDEDILNELIKNDVIETKCVFKKNGRGIILNNDGNFMFCNYFSNMFFGKFGGDIKTFDDYTIRIRDRKIVDYFKELNRYPYKQCVKCDLIDSCNGGCKLFQTNKKTRS